MLQILVAKLFSALATAEFKTFKMIAAALFECQDCPIASATLLPRMLSRTRRDLQLTYCTTIALAEVISAVCSPYFLRVFLSSAA